MAIPDWLDPILDAQQSRAADSSAINGLGIPGVDLMEKAASGLAAAIAGRCPEGLIAIVVGKGNNGGDGLAAARLLRGDGRDVKVVRLCEPDEWSGDARLMYEKLQGPSPVEATPGCLDGAAVVVDAIAGTGFAGSPRGALATGVELIGQAKAAGATVVACDIPTGVDASTGESADLAVAADITTTFNLSKVGHWVRPGKAFAGEVDVVDIGIPPDCSDPSVGLISARVVGQLPSRGPEGDKFSAGSVVVAGGSPGLTGAPMLAATGAARGSAGYVTVALPAPLLGASDAVPEVMGVGLTDNAGFHCLAGIDRLMERAQRAGSMVIGPGIGRTHSASAFVLAAIESIGAPLVIDADALHAFSGSAERIARRRQPTVLTPHSGEMASLLGIGRDEVEARRLSCARMAAQKSRAVVVLKGDDTIIASPEGQVGVSRGDSPALATAGSGDVLGGLVAALLAHSVDPFTAACAAVLMHTEAGRIAASGGAEGVIATDIAAMLPTARKQLALRAYG